MPPSPRLSADARREAILEASLALFSQHGLHGVTTRMIAKAAGVSEALLYRHFESKDDLHAELQRWCLGRTTVAAERLAALEPCTATLVLAIHFMVSEILCSGEGAERSQCLKRMNLGSLLGDGSFTRGFLKANVEKFVPKMVECLEAAHHAGEVEGTLDHPRLRVWLCHHLPVMTASFYLPPRPVVNHGVDRNTLIEEVTRFCLRGLGLRPEAIKKHFQPKALTLFMGGATMTGR